MSDIPRTKEQMTDLARMVKANLPEGCGFALFVWNHGVPTAANYIGNSNRQDVERALTKFVERSSEGRILDTPSGN